MRLFSQLEDLKCQKQYEEESLEKRIKDLQKFHEDNAAEMERDVEDGWVETTNPEKQTGQDE